ncbi:cytochrome d ubiquinol oxidase subunit II [Sphingobacterium phlebotomi]|uniref:Cytochrome d ubiquinol oxidase subunit II n=1 Tax=Sphingobacterium phlebotomi TaxID=2605433 RepID=A0A5D4GVR9_9SPHI|nr:cytochrome d ubiquinol oxidase subunit II [Sphingobacterium phlebotomi]TYR32254.1 cytochrome d ubiquinol oxidase subunit II [Sphingobacterium phlebotomi]
MLYVVIAFLWLSLYLYLILGGADFGVGILEIFTGKKHLQKVKRTTYRSIGPIWEANHMWLIIAIVILFVGFPTIYSTVSIYLHIPLVLMLLGVIARGTAFTFRHYDAIDDDWQIVYNRIFQISSLITPFFLGLIAASTVSRSINLHGTDFLTAYVYSWWNPFGISVGIFTIAISAYLASIYIIGEADNSEFIRYLIRRAKIYFFVVLLSGIAVFITAYLSDIPLFIWIFGQPIGQSAVALATLSIVVLFWAFAKEKSTIMRICAAFQTFMILVAATYNHFPDLILLANAESLSLIDHQGSEKTIEVLAWALLLGSVFILPFLFYLLYSFHRKNT